MTDKCYIRTSMEEEDKAAEGEVDSAKADTTKSVTPTNGKRTETAPESSAEGGVITPDQATVGTQLSAGTAENPATTKRSVGRRSVSKADN